MLGWIAAASGLGACWLLARWWLSGTDALGRPVPKPVVGVGLLALLSVGTGTVAFRHHVLENRLSRAASSLVGHHVRVRCQSVAGAFVDANVEPGYVRFDPDGRPEAATTLKADICRSLARYVRAPSHPSPAEVLAVHIVTHEAMHMAGTRDEAAAECAAVQRDAATARMLGARPADATLLALRYWTVTYPVLPDDYRSASCTPAGPMDEGRGDGPWPP